MSPSLPLQVNTILQDFFVLYPLVEKVVLFGSRARGDNSVKSDIDLCLFAPVMMLKEFNALRSELNELPILYKLDIVHYEHIDKALKDNIILEQKTCYQRLL